MAIEDAVITIILCGLTLGWLSWIAIVLSDRRPARDEGGRK